MSFIQNRPTSPSPSSSPPPYCGDTPHCVDMPETNEWADTASSASTPRSEGDMQTALLSEQIPGEESSPVAPEPSQPAQGANEETTPMISISSQTAQSAEERQPFVTSVPPQYQSLDANVAPQRPADLAEARRIIYEDLMSRKGLLLSMTLFLPFSTFICIWWARIRQHNINIDLVLFDLFLALTPLVAHASRWFRSQHTWVLLASVLPFILLMNALLSIHSQKSSRGVYNRTITYPLRRW